MSIDVRRDVTGVRQALSELLEHGFAQSRMTRSLDDSDEEGQNRIFGSLPQLTLSPGYYKWADYLMRLEKLKENGVIESSFTMAESEGLMALAEARNGFERSHPPCGVCSAFQDSPFATACHRCGTEFALRRTA